MKHIKFSVICFLILILISCTINNSSPKLPKDFKFEICYGTYGRNCINTFNGTYTKDLINNGNITTKLILNRNELQLIYNKMLNIELFDYPKDFKPTGVQNFGRKLSDDEGIVYTIDPYEHVKITLQLNGEIKHRQTIEYLHNKTQIMEVMRFR